MLTLTGVLVTWIGCIRGRCCMLPLHTGTLGRTQGGLGSPYPGLAGTQSGRATRLGVEWLPWAKGPDGGA